MATRLNFEIACTQAMVDLALKLRPDSVCVVPENRTEVTTEGGLDVVAGRAKVEACVQAMRAAGIEASLFIDPDSAQIEMAAKVGAPTVELHTGAYANAYHGDRRPAEFERLRAGAEHAHGLGDPAPGDLANARQATGLQLREHRRGPHPTAPPRTQHRPQHLKPRPLHGDRASRPRDEGADEPVNLQLPPGGLLLGLGADVIEVERIRGVLERQGERFMARVFTQEERDYCSKMAQPHKHLAARFAAKEAVSKAFTTGIGAELGWRSVSVYHGPRGEPRVRLDEKAEALLRHVGATRILLTLSHSETVAMAVAALVRG